MNLAIKTAKKPEEKTRLALRSGRWKTALPYFEELANADEQDSARWNLLGDMRYRAGENADAEAAWKHALDGYMHDGLHENALGVARKIARILPDETAVHPSISEAFMGLEYYADAIGAFRSFMKLNKSATSSELKSWFRRAITCDIRQPHLLEEISHLLGESGLEDVELERDIRLFVERMSETSDSLVTANEEDSFEPAPVFEREYRLPDSDGLLSIDAIETDDPPALDLNSFQPVREVGPTYESLTSSGEYEIPADIGSDFLSDGQGKDHFDLGVVYAEMKLWDAAITEFQTARKDNSIRSKATLELAQCYKNANDPHRALKLLEEESALGASEGSVQDELWYQMGLIHEVIGNTSEALESYEKVSHESAHSIEAARKANLLRVQ
ncbi:MAG: tetratricopeptide repeat protein [bacterium]|nr:tetratricopeptide repeat protein [bacterium]